MGDALHMPVRLAVCARLCGLAARAAAVACAVPAAVAVVNGDGGFALRAAVVAGAFAALGFLGRGGISGSVQRNEALVVAATMFLLLPLAMAWPFAAAGMPFDDALFETVSGITTTGLSVVDVNAAPASLLFTRAWLQWIGGLGVVLLSLAVIVPPGAAASGLDEKTLTQEGLGTTRTLARRIVAVYAGITAIGVLALLALGESALRAFAYPLASLSTGGFSPDPNGAADIATPSRIAITALCMCGAIPALLLAGRLRSADRRVALLQCTVGLALVAIVTVGLDARLDATDGATWDAAFLAVSAQTTTGFATVDTVTLDAGAKLWLVLSMFVGGPTGSTAGGIKLLRLVVAFQIARLAVERTALPRHAVAELRVAHQKFDDETVRRVLLIVVLATGTVAASWLPFVLHGHDPLDALFEVVSATGTVGLTSGVTSPDLAPGLKAILAVDMLLGRLEFLALIVMLYPGTWLGRRPAPVREEES